MRKYIAPLLIVWLLVSFSGVSASGLKGKLAIGGRGGLCLPIGAFADKGSFSTSFSDSMFGPDMKEVGNAKPGFGIGVNVEYYVTDYIGIGGYLDYQMIGMDVDKMKKTWDDSVQKYLPPGYSLSTELEGNHRITRFGLFGKLLKPVTPAISPYLRFGVGMARLKSKVDMSATLSSGTSSSGTLAVNGNRESGMKFCFDVGGGVLFVLSKNVGITAELLYTHLAIKKSDGAVNMTLMADGRAIRRNTVKDEFDFNADRIDMYLGITVMFGVVR